MFVFALKPDHIANKSIAMSMKKYHVSTNGLIVHKNFDISLI